ncbi:MAG: tripartite tricarboxylate transporter substrate binding protein [Hyphomicrobiales bacterium]|nr:tripartite tricarboxylate transporter substrate binding protein [Hyphomicrobiales bacterium]
MRPLRTLLRLLGVIALACAIGTATAVAQKYPTRAVTFVVPFPAGGLSDVASRALAAELQKQLGVPFVVENRVGGSGTIGAAHVARAEPDGYTILVNSIADVTNLHYVQVPYDILNDFTEIGMIVEGPPLVLVVNPSVPYKSVQELVERAKSSPGKLSFSSSGPGTPPAIALAQLKADAALDILDVPYRGSIPATLAVVAGEVQAGFVFQGGARPLANEGKLRALASTAVERDASWPELPTMIESGFPRFDHQGFSGLQAPARTPPEIIALLNQRLNQIIREPSFRERFVANGMRPPERNSPKDFADYLRREIVRHGELAKLMSK